MGIDDLTWRCFCFLPYWLWVVRRHQSQPLSQKSRKLFHQPAWQSFNQHKVCQPVIWSVSQLTLDPIRQWTSQSVWQNGSQLAKNSCWCLVREDCFISMVNPDFTSFRSGPGLIFIVWAKLTAQGQFQDGRQVKRPTYFHLMLPRPFFSLSVFTGTKFQLSKQNLNSNSIF